nr:uncharacterized protein LOC116431141 [Nomia melanderi]
MNAYLKMVSMYGLRWYKKYLPLNVFYFQRANIATLNGVNNNFNNHIVWLDMEMTGLDVQTCRIMEVACVVTDKDLNIVGNELNIVIHQPNTILDNMNKWNTQQHESTGLINESRLSKITIQDAEKILLNHLKTYVEEGVSPLAGSSVYMDRIFLQKYMPTVDNYLHYRLIDTSTIKELIKIWNLNIPMFKKGHRHRALADIKESIQELEYYKKNLFHS